VASVSALSVQAAGPPAPPSQPPDALIPPPMPGQQENGPSNGP
jgi:hypothetical protein